MSQANVPIAPATGPSPAGVGTGPGMSRRGLWWAAAALVLLLALLGLWYYWNNRVTVIGSQESVNVLALGTSDDGLDAVTVVSFNPVTNGLSAIAVPADTRLGASAERRVADVYAEDGVRGLVAAVEGLVAAPVHYIVQVDFGGFEALVDLLGGVTVDVESEIVYRNAEGETVFRLEPGRHKLSGAEALLYLRYKGDRLDDETRRVERQWRFLTAVAQEARANLDWQRVQGMVQLAIRYVQTDLDLAEATRLAQFAWQAEPSIALHLLPGRAEDGVWVVDAAAARTLSESVFHNPGWVAARR